MSDNTVKTPAPIQTTPAIPSMEELAKQLVDLQKKVNEKVAAKPVEVIDKTASSEPEIDWTKIEEKDIFDLTIPIPAIEQEVPDYLNMHVKDKMYVTRWIHKLRERLGPCLAAGYTYVSKEELDNRYPISLEPDSEGHYTFGDVVLLKVLKSRYFSALRRNHEKTMSIHGIAKVQGKVSNQVSNANPRLESALRRGAISFYEQEAREESGPDLEAVTL